MSKLATKKQYQERIIKVWIYIQNNLDVKHSLDELASIACLSPYHFHRIFKAYTSETTSQYFRRLKLERAANRISFSNDDITTIAFNAGYDSHAAFSKAFKQRFAISPTEFRQNHNTVDFHPDYKTNFHEEKYMDCKIINIPAKRVLFTRRTGPYVSSAYKAWGALSQYACDHNLMNEETESIGLFHDSPDVTEEDKMRYDACITVGDNVKPDGEFAIQDIEGGDYAMFIHKGSYENLETTYDQIMRDWLPGQNRELREIPIHERYLNAELMETAPDELLTEIYIPVK